MCGIFGIGVRGASGLSRAAVVRAVNELFHLSESRGSEAAGCAVVSPSRIDVFKDSIPPSRLIRSPRYGRFIERAVADWPSGGYSGALFIFGHSRLVTDGSQEAHYNNQPVVADGIVGVHNGIIVNAEDLYARFPSLKREYEVDTEMLLRLIDMFRKEGKSLQVAVGGAFGLIEGAASVAIGFDDADVLVLATNTGSLHMCQDISGTAVLFASERSILSRLVRRRYVRRFFSEADIAQVEAGSGYCIGLTDLLQQRFGLAKAPSHTVDMAPVRATAPRTVIDHTAESARGETLGRIPARDISCVVGEFEANYRRNEEAVSGLRRCTKCILPETMPFIEFDDAGVCNYCREYKKVHVRGREALLKAVAPCRRTDGGADCIVSVSGGRDSIYGLHYVKNVLKLNPIAYTYDWGMVTDLARRNVSRLCGKLGIEHILISADIAEKRDNIRKNVDAWLRKPDLGMVPLFMAGDKHYFYYMNKLRTQTGIKLTIYSDNPLEKTEFKSGFCGVREPKGESYYTLPGINKFKLACYYGKQLLANPSYLNASLLDSLSAFYSTYGLSHDYLMLYGYVRWDEEEVTGLIRNRYNWELAPDTSSTWRIGDGTAPFYNYIYYSIAGFTENDTFRSNQIREGMIDRERALALVREENRPRYESIHWYCATIGVDFCRVIRKINSIPHRY